jgi:general nucleoside transport system permease protein
MSRENNSVRSVAWTSASTVLLYAGIALIVITALVLRYTSIGLAIHAAGAEPKAVDKSGLSVTRVRYACVMFAGFMASLSGAFPSIGDIHTFTEGMTRGAGHLAIAPVIFGKWRIGGTTLACLLFGGATALQFQLRRSVSVCPMRC